MAGSDVHVLDVGDVRFAIDARIGGRVVSFRLDGVDALVGPDVDPKNYGSTLWTSPQADWGWPPPASFDEAPYTVRAESGAVTMTGPACDRLGVRLVKRFSVDRARVCIRLEYAVQNVGEVPLKCALWEVSRVPSRGLTFYATGASSGGPLPVDHRSGGTWFAHDPGTLSEVGEKTYGDAGAGFVAHVLEGGRLLFVKSFVDLPPESQVPGEGEVEIYGNDRYVEVEVQGPYATIAPGAWSDRWAVRWYLRTIPSTVTPSLGNPDLLELAASIAG
jgi:hypothetical protein